MSVQFAVLASGSRGNSTLVRGRGAGLLIDVGIGPKAIGERLESVGASWSRIAAVVLTHTHGDHVDTATFAELARRGVTLHCHEGHRQVLADDSGFQKLEEARLIRLYDDGPFLTSTGLRLEPIELRHDGGPTFGFRIEASAERRERPVSIGYLADTGCWSENMADSLTDVDVLGVEFNHDVALQKSSAASRVSDRAKLERRGSSIEPAGGRADPGGPGAIATRVRCGTWSCLHLSEQCNQPDLAIKAAGEAHSIAAGRLAQVHAAQTEPGFSQSLDRSQAAEPAPRRRLSAPEPRPPSRQQTGRPRRARGVLTGLLFGEPDQD